MDENLDLTKNTELNQALKEFEEKSGAEQAQQDSSVSKNSEVPKMVQWVMKLGLAKSERQAEYVLLGFVVVIIIISLFLFLGSQKTETQKDVKILPAVF